MRKQHESSLLLHQHLGLKEMSDIITKCGMYISIDLTNGFIPHKIEVVHLYHNSV